MNKHIGLALNRYAPVPPSLVADPQSGRPLEQIEVPLASLYHHYYLDTPGQLPPSPDPTQFEHLRFLLPSGEFRFVGSGLGVSPTAKRHRSNELGQAFCRWFLHDHLNIVHFAHMHDVLRRQAQRQFAQCTVRRKGRGDTPDYFCAQDTGQVCLAEAKGSYSRISFGTSEFQGWRRQFDRVEVSDGSGNVLSVKGHIVATRFATEIDPPHVRSKLLAEDPSSPGDRPLTREAASELADATIALHYAAVAQKLNQPLLALSLAAGVPLPKEVLLPVVTWRLLLDPNPGRRFVGGYYLSDGARPPFRVEEGQLIHLGADPLRLDSYRGTFVGLDEVVFRSLVRVARSDARFVESPPQPESIAFLYSAISLLRDGSALGPAEFFIPAASESL